MCRCARHCRRVPRRRELRRSGPPSRANARRRIPNRQAAEADFTRPSQVLSARQTRPTNQHSKQIRDRHGVRLGGSGDAIHGCGRAHRHVERSTCAGGTRHSVAPINRPRTHRTPRADQFQRHQFRALQIILPAFAGGHTVRGGVMKPGFPMNGNKELKRTAGSPAARRVASSQSSSHPSDFMAWVTAEFRAHRCGKSHRPSRSPADALCATAPQGADALQSDSFQ